MFSILLPSGYVGAAYVLKIHNTPTVGAISISDFASKTKKEKSSPRWRFNFTLLMYPNFRESLRTQIKLFKELNLHSAPSLGAPWDAFIKGHVIQPASFKKK